MSRLWIGSIVLFALALFIHSGVSNRAIAQAAPDTAPVVPASWKSTLSGPVDVYLQPEPVSSLRASLIGVTLEEVRTIGTMTLLTFKESKGTARWVVNAQHVTAIRIAESK